MLSLCLPVSLSVLAARTREGQESGREHEREREREKQNKGERPNGIPLL
jgi:hypothetical protein